MNKAIAFIALLSVFFMPGCNSGKPGESNKEIKGTGQGAKVETPLQTKEAAIPDKESVSKVEPKGAPVAKPKGDQKVSKKPVPESKWPDSMARAFERAKKEGKLVIVELHDKDCEYCMMMDKVLAENKVKKTLESFIFTVVDVYDKKAKALIEEHVLSYTPTFLLYDSKGNYVEDSEFLEGFRQAPTFLAELKNFGLVAQGKEEVEVPDDDHPDFGKG